MAYLRNGKKPFLLLLFVGLPGAWPSPLALQRMRRASVSSISRVLRFASSALSDRACREGLTMIHHQKLHSQHLRCSTQHQSPSLHSPIRLAGFALAMPGYAPGHMSGDMRLCRLMAAFQWACLGCSSCMGCAVDDLGLFSLQALHIVEDVLQHTPVFRLGTARQ